MVDQINKIFPPNSVSNPGFLRHETLLTPTEMRKRFLFGVEFKDANGNELEDSVFQDAIGDGISTFEHEFGITVNPTTYTEPYDYRFEDYNNYCYLQLNHRPVIEVKGVNLKIANNVVLSPFPLDWVQLYKDTGQIQLVPTIGSIGQFNILGGLPYTWCIRRNYPQMLEIEYVAGFEQDRIPKIVNSYIGMNAAISLLIIAGDLIIGPGISSQSISFDGLSQSLNSTLSAENSGYGGRIREYLKELKDCERIIRKFYCGLTSVVC